MCKKKLKSKTINTLTTITFNLKSSGGGIKIPCTYIFYRLFVCLLSVSISEVLLLSLSAEALIRGVKHVLGEMVAYMRGSLYAEAYKVEKSGI